MTRRTSVAAIVGGLTAVRRAAANPTVPRKAGEFVINMPQGGYQLLTSYRGKVIVFELLSTTCPHCQHSAQVLTQLQREYGPKGFQALGCAFNPMAKMLVPDFVREFNVGIPIGWSEREPVHDFLQIPRTEAMHVPQMVIIDRKGMVRQQSLPRGDATVALESNLRHQIQTLLAEAGAPRPAAAARKQR